MVEHVGALAAQALRMAGRARANGESTPDVVGVPDDPLIELAGNSKLSFAMRWRLTLRGSHPGITVYAVATALGDDGDKDGRNIRPGVRKIAGLLGCNKDTVAEVCAFLAAHGWLELVRPAGRRRAAEYRLTLPRLSRRTGLEPGVHGPPEPLRDQFREWKAMNKRPATPDTQQPSVRPGRRSVRPHRTRVSGQTGHPALLSSLPSSEPPDQEENRA